MKHDQFAALELENGAILRVNTQYITAYGYSKEQDKTVVALLGERQEVYFPGDQTHEIYVSFNSIE